MLESWISQTKWLSFGIGRRSMLLTAASSAIAAIVPAGALGQDATPIKLALAFGGGSIKGAYQAGVTKVLLNKGFVPDSLYGISVGSLNAAFLCDRAYFLGKTKGDYYSGLGEMPPADLSDPKAPVTWPFIGEQLAAFWTQKITGPSALVTEWPEIGIFIRIILGEFNGVVGVNPLKKLIADTLSSDRLSKSSVPTEIGAVNIDTGAIKYVSNSDSDFIDFLLASAAVPLVMPIVEIAGADKGRYVDGGARHIVPVKKAADGPATHIVCIACQAPIGADNYQPVQKPTNILQLITRLTEIASDNVIAKDVNDVKEANKDKEANKKKVALIRPDSPLETEIQKPQLEINDFKAEDIKNLISRGEFYASRSMKEGGELSSEFFK
jgi:NTE family protein